MSGVDVEVVDVDVDVVGVGNRFWSVSYLCFLFIVWKWCALRAMVRPQAVGLPSGYVLLDVSVLCHFYYEFIYCLSSASGDYFSREVSFFD